MFRKKSHVSSGEKVDTIIGNGTYFNGNLKVEGTLRIDGKVDGEIVLNGDVIIGKGGFVQANIKGANASIAGEIHGNITLDGKLEINNTGKVFGDIDVATLVISEGAVFKGESKMRSNGEKSDTISLTRNKENAKVKAG